MSTPPALETQSVDRSVSATLVALVPVEAAVLRLGDVAHDLIPHQHMVDDLSLLGGHSLVVAFVVAQRDAATGQSILT